MAVQQIPPSVRHLGRLLTPARPAATDAALLLAFRQANDQAAFAELVRRHGPLVRAVCRRVLGDRPAADDAWQATFLVLARRAAALTGVGSLAGWLHGVAYRTALNERRAARRRTAREGHARPAAVIAPDKQAAWRELQELVDAEIRRLPGPLQDVFVRCCLEHAGCPEVAAELGLNEGTVRSRLARGRGLLRVRLERRGVCLSAALALAAVTSDQVCASLVSQTTEAAVRLATGKDVAGLVSPHVLAMARGPGVAFTRGLLVALVLAAGVLGVTRAQLPGKPADPLAAKTPAVAAAKGGDMEPLPAGALVRFGTDRFRTNAEVRALAYSPDGTRLAAWSGSPMSPGQFSLWDAATGRRLVGRSGDRSTCWGFAWGPDGRALAIVRDDGFTFRVLDFMPDPPVPRVVPGGPPFGPPGMGLDQSTAVAVSPDGTRLAVATRRAVIVVEAKPATSVQDLKELARYDAPPGRCLALAFTPDGKRLVGACAVGRGNGLYSADTVVVWDAAGKPARTFPAPDQVVLFEPAVSVSDGAVAFGRSDENVAVADLATGTVRTIPTGDRKPDDNRGPGMCVLAFAPDGKTVASSGRDAAIRLSDVATGKVVRELGRHPTFPPRALAFSPDGKRLASGGYDGIIRIWDTAAGGEAIPTGGHADGVRRARISADGRTVLTDARDGRVWDGATGTERRRIASGPVTQVGFGPGHMSVVALTGSAEGADRALKVWDAGTGTVLTPPGFAKPIPARGFQFTPDGGTLLAHYEDRLTAYAWPAGTKRWSTEMPKPAKGQGIYRVSAVIPAPDGRTFVTVAPRVWEKQDKDRLRRVMSDGAVDLFETATGRYVRRLIDCTAIPEPGVFAADGSFIHNGGGKFPNDFHGGKARETRAQLCVLDPLTGRLVREFAPSGRVDGMDTAFTLARSADGKVLFQATQIGEVLAFEVATGTFRTAFVGHRDLVLALDAPTDVRRLLSGSKDTTALLWNVGFGGKKGAALTPADRPKLWEALASEDGKTGYEAMTALAADPAGFVELATAEVKPAPAGPTAADLAPIFRDLDAAAFAVREAAAAKLERYGESALGLVRAELERTPSAEVRGRLERFVEKCDGPGAFPDRLRAGRVVELLEHLGTPPAKALLAKLAAGGPARLTTDAAGAVKRLAGR